MKSNLIREKREDLGISQTKLACRVELAQSTLSSFELDKVKPWPKARRLLAQALQCPEDQLFPDSK